MNSKEPSKRSYKRMFDLVMDDERLIQSMLVLALDDCAAYLTEEDLLSPDEKHDMAGSMIRSMVVACNMLAHGADRNIDATLDRIYEVARIEFDEETGEHYMEDRLKKLFRVYDVQEGLSGITGRTVV